MNRKKDLKTETLQDMLIDIAFNVISEVNFDLERYGIEVKCFDFRVEENNCLALDIIDSNNATLGVSVRISDMSPEALEEKIEGLTSMISASYGEFYLFLYEGKL